MRPRKARHPPDIEPGVGIPLDDRLTAAGGNIVGSLSIKPLTLSPGASPAKVIINGNLTLNGDDTLLFELNGVTAGTDYDQLVVTGNLILGGAHLENVRARVVWNVARVQLESI